MKKIKIKILPVGKEIVSTTTVDLLQTLIYNGENIYSSCGGEGSCGKCKIKILSGEYRTEEYGFITDEEKKQGIVLACKTFPETDLEVEILEETKISYIKTAESETSVYPGDKFEIVNKIVEDNKWSKSSPIKVLSVKLSPPSIEDPISDCDRLKKFVLTYRIKNFSIHKIDHIRSLPEKIRGYNWEVKLLLKETLYQNQPFYELFEILDKNETEECYGLAIDVGTTTVAVSLLNLATYETISTRTSFNQQMVYGDDIISRMVYAETADGLKDLNKKIVSTINELINIILSENKILLKNVYTAVVAGNTTMMHLLYSIPPRYIRREPYVPAVTQIPPVSAKELGIMINPNGIIYALPLVASYVGGDIVAGVVASGIDRAEKVSVLLDLGTNGEIVVGNKEYLICAACSAGPAFEGVGLKSGMRATIGAIEDIVIDNDKILYKVIGGGIPIGICGSGLIDIPAELFKNGIIDRSGKFVKDIKNRKSNTKILEQKVRINNDGEKEFVIVEKSDSKTNKDIVITESDIANILRSKGAVFHGLYTLLKYLNLQFTDIEKIYISGGFGSFIDINKAQILGLLPELPEEKFVVIGNSSLTGAKLYLSSVEVRKKVYEIAQKMTYVELSTEPMFMNEYTSALFLPHTDLNLFPKVSRILG